MNSSKVKSSNNNNIKLILGDWLTNAGIVGFLRIIRRIQPECQEKPLLAKLANDFIEINPENGLKFFADAYCSSALMDVIENLFLQRQFHYKIKARKRNDILDNIRSKLIGIENNIFSTIRASVDYKDFNLTLGKTVKALRSLKEKNLQLFADNKDNNKIFETIRNSIDKDIAKKIEVFESQKFLVTYLQKFYQNRAVI